MKDRLYTNILRGIRKKIRGQENLYKRINWNWFDLRIIKNMPEDRENIVKLFDRRIHVFGRIGFIHAVREIFLEELYKIELNPNPFIIDCGANIGLSVIYFKRRFPNSTIIAFEPDEVNFELLKKNISIFNFTGITLEKKAVWKENTTLSFSNEGTMMSKIVDAGTYRVEAIKLKDLINKSIDLLKIDIEGAEYEVLVSIREDLYQVKNLFIEYHGSFSQNFELNKIFKILTEAGFSYYIKEAAPVYLHPFIRKKPEHVPYDIQLNIFCFRTA